jgi:hypothetical protein
MFYFSQPRNQTQPLKKKERKTERTRYNLKLFYKIRQSLTTKNKMLAAVQCCLLQAKSFLNILAFLNSSIDNERHCTDTFAILL